LQRQVQSDSPIRNAFPRPWTGSGYVLLEELAKPYMRGAVAAKQQKVRDPKTQAIGDLGVTTGNGDETMRKPLWSVEHPNQVSAAQYDGYIGDFERVDAESNMVKWWRLIAPNELRAATRADPDNVPANC